MLETTLLSEPQILSRTQKFTIAYKGQKFFVTTTLFPQYHYGDNIKISGNTKFVLLNNKTIIMTIGFPKIEAVKTKNNKILAVTSIIRQRVISIFKNILPSTYSSLMLGIVFGIKDNFSSEFLQKLRISGVLHVIAASGMNVTMTGGFLSFIFSFLFKRQIAVALSIAGIVFYAILAGLEASIIRATVMGILVFTSQILGRQSFASYGLMLAGFLMLFWDPDLISDVGFQLSFMATLGLLYLKPLMRFEFLQKSLVGEDFLTTISAQAATFPILIVNFGIYSLWSVIVNALVLWTVPVLMIFGAIGAFLGLFSQALASIALFLSLPFLIYFEKIVSFFASLPGTLTLNNLSWQFSAGYYILLLSVVSLLKKKA